MRPDVIIDGTMSEEAQNNASTNPAPLAPEADADEGAAHLDASTNVSQTQIPQVHCTLLCT